MNERTPYPLERLGYDEFIERYSKGDTSDPGLTEDEFYEFKRELYEMCLEKIGVDFEMMHLFHFELSLIKNGWAPRTLPVPHTEMDSTDGELYEALDVAKYNLSIVQEAFDREWRIYQWRMRDRYKAKELEDETK